MIEVGEYVRINNDFRLIALGIGQVIRINQDTIYVKMNFEMPFAFKIENIAKHSKNLIDLIEVGDYVNKEEIIEVRKQNGKIYLMTSYCPQNYIKHEIKEILTKEQYMKNCYTVERKEEC